MTTKTKTIYVLISLVILTVLGLVIFKKDMLVGGFGVGTENEKSEKISGPSVYTHPVLGFNINLPSGFTVGNFEEGSGSVALVQDSDKKYGMQIFTSSFNEDTTLTAERIKKDIPDIKMERSEQILLGSASGVSFYSVSEDGRKIREVWLVYGGNLYQISAEAKYDDTTEKILKSWSW